MSYAIRNDGQGWRSVDGPEDVGADEVFSPTQPAPVYNASAIIEAKKQTVRALREQVLDRLAGIAGRASRKGDTALAAACDTASEALLDITKNLPSDPDSVELELFSRYQVIVFNAIQTSPSLATAFAQVDV